MNNFRIICAIFLIILSFGFIGRDELPKEKTKDFSKHAPCVYIDCSSCDFDYIRTKISFVKYVRDQNDADIYVLVTSINTGGNGTEYTLDFKGHEKFKGIDDKLKVAVAFDATDDHIRSEIVRLLKLGLAHYLAHTPLEKYVSVSVKGKVDQEKVSDPWDHWTFTLGFNGYFSGEKSTSSIETTGYVNADRVTEAWRIALYSHYNYCREKYEVDDDTITSVSDQKYFSSGIVKSLTDHWSLGLFTKINSSTYENYDLYIKGNPEIEYNIFPYKEATRKQIRIMYSPGIIYANYKEMTIYDKLSQVLFGQYFGIAFQMKEPWGNINVYTEALNYFNDFSKYRIILNPSVSLKIFKGLSFNISAGVSLINDQLNLEKGDITTAEVLLSQRELATSYDYWTSIGLSYTFGSKFNNVVNPRFGY